MNDIPQSDLYQILSEARAKGARMEFDEQGRLVICNDFRIGGVFTAKVLEHEMMARALESGDPGEVQWAERMIRDNGWVASGYGYYEKGQAASHNLLPVASRNNCLDVWLGNTAKSATWYIATFTSDWNTAGADAALSNWAGASSGPLATELADAAYDETNRQAATFGTAASGGVIASSAPTRYTLATGQSGVSIYGAVLTNVATVAYNSTDKILAAATSFPTPITGLAATHKIDLEYSLTAANAS